MHSCTRVVIQHLGACCNPQKVLQVLNTVVEDKIPDEGNASLERIQSLLGAHYEQLVSVGARVGKKKTYKSVIGPRLCIRVWQLKASFHQISAAAIVERGEVAETVTPAETATEAAATAAIAATKPKTLSLATHKVLAVQAFTKAFELLAADHLAARGKATTAPAVGAAASHSFRSQTAIVIPRPACSPCANYS